jgi:hypothetical protein
MVEPVTDVERMARDLDSMALSRILTASPKMLHDAATALRTLQERVTSLERVNAALNDTIDHLENVVAEWRGDRTT